MSLGPRSRRVGRLASFPDNEDEARGVVTGKSTESDRIEIWTWPEGEFQKWVSAMGDKTELFGEASERVFNLVVNDVAYSVSLLSI